jgi:hypothetical protein
VSRLSLLLPELRSAPPGRERTELMLEALRAARGVVTSAIASLAAQEADETERADDAGHPYFDEDVRP